MASFLGSVLHKLISFHSVDINRRKNFSYCVKKLLFCTNICKEIHVIVLLTAMQGDIKICKEIHFILLHIGMQRDINTCKEIYFIVLHIDMERDINMQRDVFYCIEYMYARRCKFCIERPNMLPFLFSSMNITMYTNIPRYIFLLCVKSWILSISLL